MAKRNLLLVFLVVAMSLLTTVRVYATPVVIPLEIGIFDPSNGQDGPGKTPIQIPHVSIEIHTLYFGTSCGGYTLHIVDENDDVVYSTVVPTGATSLILPAYLCDTYELQLLPNNCNYYFYGTVDL